jgi:CysZ protein
MQKEGDMMNAFIRGFSYPFQSIGILGKNRLWHLSVIPAVIALGLFIFMLVLGFRLAGPLRDAIWSGDISAAGFLGGLLTALRASLKVIFFLLFAGLSFLLYVMLAPALAAPFLDLISEKTEKALVGSVPTPRGLGGFFRAALFGLGDALRILGLTLAGNLLLMPLNLLPLLGNMLFVLISAVLCWYMLAVEFSGMPANRRYISFSSRLRIMGKNPGVSLGFGLAVQLLLFVPVLNVLLLSMAASGSTMLFLDLFPEDGADR